MQTYISQVFMDESTLSIVSFLKNIKLIFDFTKVLVKINIDLFGGENRQFYNSFILKHYEDL